MNYDIYLLGKSHELFVKKDGINFNNPNVIAAIVTCASEMLKFSKNPSTSEEIVIEELLDVFHSLGDNDVEKLVGMSPSLVNSIIGFDIDFKDYNAGHTHYLQSKNTYDTYYKMILNRHKALHSKRSI